MRQASADVGQGTPTAPGAPHGQARDMRAYRAWRWGRTDRGRPTGLRPPWRGVPGPRPVRGSRARLRGRPQDRAGQRPAEERPGRCRPRHRCVLILPLRLASPFSPADCARAPAFSSVRGPATAAAENNAGGAGAGGGINSLATIFQSPDLLNRILSNPKTAPYIAQPDFVEKLKELQADGTKLSKCVAVDQQRRRRPCCRPADTHRCGACDSRGVARAPDQAHVRPAHPERPDHAHHAARRLQLCRFRR